MFSRVANEVNSASDKACSNRTERNRQKRYLRVTVLHVKAMFQNFSTSQKPACVPSCACEATCRHCFLSPDV